MLPAEVSTILPPETLYLIWLGRFWETHAHDGGFCGKMLEISSDSDCRELPS